MIDIIILSLLLIIPWIFGRCILHIVKAEKSLNDLSIAIGLSVVIIVVNLLYFVGDFRISSIRMLLIVCFVFSVLYLAACFWRGSKSAPTDLISSFLMYSILILPAIIGGEQYYVFRGNWWDHFMYLSTGYGFSNYQLSSILELNNTSILSNDLLVYVKDQYNFRPSVLLLFSLFLSKGSGDIFFRGFLYNSAFLAAVYPPLKMIFRLINSRYNLRSWLLSLLPVGFIAGFWGQYIFDIQSWGQLASYSLLLSFIASYLILLDRWHTSGGGITSTPPLIPYSVSILLFAGSWFIYPENALLHLVMLASASTVWLYLSHLHAKWRTIVWLTALPLFSLLFAVPNYETTIGFIIPQTSEGLTRAQNYWSYFDTYLTGIDTDFQELVSLVTQTIKNTFPFQSLLHSFWHIPFYGIVSFFGFYFITPQSTSALLYYPWLLLVIAFSIAISAAFSRNLFITFREVPTPILFIRLSCMTGLMLTGYLAARGLFWSAGKALSFTSPYLYILLLLPLVYCPPISDKGPLKYMAVAVAYSALVFSLGFGIVRVYASLDEHGIGYYRNYPSIQGKEHKIDVLWKLDIEQARGCSGVDLNLVSNPFFQHYAKLKLAYAGIPYFTRQPVLTYLVVGDLIGMMPPVPIDCYLRPEPDDKGRLVVSVQKFSSQ